MRPARWPPPKTRFPRQRDREEAFEPAGPLRGKLTFREILDYHAPEAGRFTLFRVHSRRLAGAACFALGEQEVRVDFLTRNDLLAITGVSVGIVLVGAIEAFAAFHGREAITLEAMHDPVLIAWYESRGFAPEGPRYHDLEWGDLLPMVKRVEAARRSVR